jgi:DNA-binding NarL/FixJ family response regulator
MMGAGASGYLMKTARAAELLDAVEKVNDGESVLDPAIAAKVARLWGARGSQDRHQARQRDSETLTSREIEVLTLAAMGMRNKAIADHLVISVRTVEGHVNAILTKLGFSTRTEAALYAVSTGLVQLHEKDQPSAREPF